jgi:hypothetical protein
MASHVSPAGEQAVIQQCWCWPGAPSSTDLSPPQLPEAQTTTRSTRIGWRQTVSEGGLRAVGGFGNRTRCICFFCGSLPFLFVGDRPFKSVGAITQSLATNFGDFVVAWRHGRRAGDDEAFGSGSCFKRSAPGETAKPRFWQSSFAGAVAFPNWF